MADEKKNEIIAKVDEVKKEVKAEVKKVAKKAAAASSLKALKEIGKGGSGENSNSNQEHDA